MGGGAILTILFLATVARQHFYNVNQLSKLWKSYFLLGCQLVIVYLFPTLHLNRDNLWNNNINVNNTNNNIDKGS